MSKDLTKFEKFTQSILDKAQDFSTLSIKTLMGSMSVIDENGNVGFSKGQEIEGITSDINLLDGDINTQISEPFYKKYPELVQFHQSRELQGTEIIKNNVETLKEIVKSIVELTENKGNKAE